MHNLLALVEYWEVAQRVINKLVEPHLLDEVKQPDFVFEFGGKRRSRKCSGRREQAREGVHVQLILNEADLNAAKQQEDRHSSTVKGLTPLDISLNHSIRGDRFEATVADSKA